MSSKNTHRRGDEKKPAKVYDYTFSDAFGWVVVMVGVPTVLVISGVIVLVKFF